MRVYIPLVVLFFLLSSRSFAQQSACDCEKEFLFVKSYIEKNYAGFSDKVNASNKQDYEAFSKGIADKAKSASKTSYCYFYIRSWLRYFKDGHNYLVSNPGSKSTDSSEVIALSNGTIDELKKKPINDIEGIYASDNGKYEIALIKQVNSFRDYAGIIVKTTSNDWKPGQVKLELKHIKDNSFEGILYYGDHHPEILKCELREGKLGTDYAKTDTTKRPATATLKPQTDNEPFPDIENSDLVAAYRDVNDSTAYIRIKSFDDQFAKKIKSVITKNEKKIKNKPYLIIDVRYNGGGSDYCYSWLTPLLYSDPVLTKGVDVYSTPDNIKAWQRILEENPKLPGPIKNNINNIIAAMKASPDQMVNVAPDHTDTLKKVYASPKKIVVLVDKGCASTTEQFLLEATQSRKVVIAGQPTGGVLDYSNVRTQPMSCLPYKLGYATTRSRRLPENGIDGKGIQPDLLLDFNSAQWFSTALSQLYK